MITVLIKKKCFITSCCPLLQQPFPHESLLMNHRELKLSSAEKKAAKRGYEEEKRASVPYTRPSYAHYYPASDQSLTNIPAFSQRNWSVKLEWFHKILLFSFWGSFFRDTKYIPTIFALKKMRLSHKEAICISVQAPSHTHWGETSG